MDQQQQKAPLPFPVPPPSYASLLTFVLTSKDPTACSLVGCSTEQRKESETWGRKGGRKGTLYEWTQLQCKRCGRVDEASRRFLPPHQHMRFDDSGEPV